MEEAEWQMLYQHDAQVLGEIGQVLTRAPLAKLEVRLPRDLAGKAVAAWDREDAQAPAERETCEQRLQRHRAGVLALIGLSVAQAGRWEDDEVVVELDAVFVGLAIDAADDVVTM